MSGLARKLQLHEKLHSNRPLYGEQGRRYALLFERGGVGSVEETLFGKLMLKQNK
jgi:hypothetical protein